MGLPLVVDWDDTLVFSHDGPTGEWIPGGKEFLKFSKRQGWRIVVQSARANYPAGKAEIEATLAKARHTDIEVVGKPLGFAYIDNCGVEFRGSWTETRAKVIRLA